MIKYVLYEKSIGGGKALLTDFQDEKMCEALRARRTSN